jgi:hypothetical protein
MTAVREAIVLPLLFLTVFWLAGVRTGADVLLVPPPLVTLLLAVLLLGTLHTGGVCAFDRVLGPHRAPLANLSGALLLIAIGAASAQVFNLLLPESGLLFFLFSAFFAILLLTTLAAAGDRARLLRALFVMIGSVFAFKYVVLSALYDPNGGLLTRALTAMLEGVSLGTLRYAPPAPATGYVGFGALVLYFAGLVMLPGRGEERGTSLEVRESRIEVRGARGERL